MDSEYSLVAPLQDNIVVETVKVAEDSDALIVRAYETWNSKTSATLLFCDEIENATECNLLEEEDVAVDFVANEINTTFKPFEIKTFKIRFKK